MFAPCLITERTEEHASDRDLIGALGTVHIGLELGNVTVGYRRKNRKFLG